MANFNLSITLGSTTRTRNGTASAGDLTRFVAALRAMFPQAASDNDAVDLFLNEIVGLGKKITREYEQTSAVHTYVDTVAEISVT